MIETNEQAARPLNERIEDIRHLIARIANPEIGHALHLLLEGYRELRKLLLGDDEEAPVEGEPTDQTDPPAA